MNQNLMTRPLLAAGVITALLMGTTAADAHPSDDGPGDRPTRYVNGVQTAAGVQTKVDNLLESPGTVPGCRY